MEMSLTDIVASMLTRMKIQYPDRYLRICIYTIKNDKVLEFSAPEGIAISDYDYIIVDSDPWLGRVYIDHGIVVPAIYIEDNMRIDLVGYGWQLKNERLFGGDIKKFDARVWPANLTQKWIEAKNYAHEWSVITDRELEMRKLLEDSGISSYAGAKDIRKDGCEITMWYACYDGHRRLGVPCTTHHKASFRLDENGNLELMVSE